VQDRRSERGSIGADRIMLRAKGGQLGHGDFLGTTLQQFSEAHPVFKLNTGAPIDR
jgi:hypothetical protein